MHMTQFLLIWIVHKLVIFAAMSEASYAFHFCAALQKLSFLLCILGHFPHWFIFYIFSVCMLQPCTLWSCLVRNIPMCGCSKATHFEVLTPYLHILGLYPYISDTRSISQVLQSIKSYTGYFDSLDIMILFSYPSSIVIARDYCISMYVYTDTSIA